jgi:hypothetical protein
LDAPIGLNAEKPRYLGVKNHLKSQNPRWGKPTTGEGKNPTTIYICTWYGTRCTEGMDDADATETEYTDELRRLYRCAMMQGTA